MNLESIKTDLRYAADQLRKARLYVHRGNTGLHEDCERRALDALERVEAALNEPPEVESSGQWNTDDLLRNEG